MNGKPRIFIAHGVDNDLTGAPSIHLRMVAEGLKKLGYIVRHCAEADLRYRKLRIAKSVLDSDILYIRLDGYHLSEKYSLFKLIKPSLKILWEINGTEEELAIHLRGQKCPLVKIKILIRGLIRKVLSRFTSAAIGIRNSCLVPNGTNPKRFNPSRTTSISRFNPKLFKVFWAGMGNFPWQGLDIIFSVAKKSIACLFFHIQYALHSTYYYSPDASLG